MGSQSTNGHVSNLARKGRVRQIATALVLGVGMWTLGMSRASAQTKGDGAEAVVAQQDPYKIRQVTDDLYRFTDNRHHSVFLVTDEGIVVTDPIDSDAAEWLRGQLRERFDAPVRYVVYSHSHPDHVYGGEVFDEPGVTYVSHRKTRADLERTRADTTLPDVVFDGQTTLHVGDHDLRLTYHGPNNGRGSISMLFERADVLFVVDWVVVGRLPYKDLSGYDLVGMMESTREVLEMNFETFVGGHADIGDRDDVRRYLDYLETLYDGVVDGMHAGQSLEQIQKDLKLRKFSDWAMYGEWRKLNIEGAYEMLRDDDYMLMRPEVPDPD